MKRIMIAILYLTSFFFLSCGGISGELPLSERFDPVLRACIEKKADKSIDDFTEEDFANLKVITCVENDSTIKSFKGVDLFSNLEEFYIVDCQITDMTPLKQLKHLKKLTMVECGIKDVSIFLDFPKLEELYIQENDYQTVEPLKNLKHLKKLQIGGNLISSKWPSYLMARVEGTDNSSSGCYYNGYYQEKELWHCLDKNGKHPDLKLFEEEYFCSNYHNINYPEFYGDVCKKCDEMLGPFKGKCEYNFKFGSSSLKCGDIIDIKCNKIPLKCEFRRTQTGKIGYGPTLYSREVNKNKTWPKDDYFIPISFESCKDCYDLLGKDAKCSYKKQDGKIYAQCGESKVECRVEDKPKAGDIELKYVLDSGIKIFYKGQNYFSSIDCHNNKLYPELGGCWFAKDFHFFKTEYVLENEKGEGTRVYEHVEFGDAVYTTDYDYGELAF